MTNPNNAVGTNGAFGGRTSLNALNDGLASYSAGILSGWACSPSSGLTVVLGGDGNTRDVAIAEDNAGNKTTINNISGSPISVTVGNAPNNNSRIDSIVAYVDNPPTGSATATDNYGACGLIVVAGTVASSPVAPNESAIRTAITSDGGSGTTAYYVVLANVTVASGTTDLTSDDIADGDLSKVINITKMFKSGTPVSLGFTGATGGSWTSTGFGLVQIQTAVASNQYVTITLNGATVMKIQGGASAFTWIPASILVTKGDIITATSSDNGGYAQVVVGNCNFYPLV